MFATQFAYTAQQEAETTDAKATRMMILKAREIAKRDRITVDEALRLLALDAAEQRRDAAIAEYETLQAAGANADTLTALGDALNALHDAISDLEQAGRFIGTDKGDWNDRTSRWHY